MGFIPELQRSLVLGLLSWPSHEVHPIEQPWENHTHVCTGERCTRGRSQLAVSTQGAVFCARFCAVVLDSICWTYLANVARRCPVGAAGGVTTVLCERGPRHEEHKCGIGRCQIRIALSTTQVDLQQRRRNGLQVKQECTHQLQPQQMPSRAHSDFGAGCAQWVPLPKCPFRHCGRSRSTALRGIGESSELWPQTNGNTAAPRQRASEIGRDTARRAPLERRGRMMNSLLVERRISQEFKVDIMSGNFISNLWRGLLRIDGYECEGSCTKELL